MQENLNYTCILNRILNLKCNQNSKSIIVNLLPTSLIVLLLLVIIDYYITNNPTNIIKVYQRLKLNL